MAKTKENRLLMATIVISLIVCIAGLYHKAELAECEASHIKKENEIERILNHYMHLNSAYGDLLHKVWIDNPCYVEKELKMSEEFQVIDDIYEGDWEDIFALWDLEDSIQYDTNKQECEKVE